MTPELNDRIAVFAGPSLPSQVRPADPVFTWLPPAMAGDAFALDGQRPRAVVLIDGLFDAAPAIRHKELLVLMARGTPLIGGASMGALRAAELHGFGMLGVGRIFDAFAGNRLIGDDEVALLHGPAELDWAPLTEALVNVRATVLSAVRARQVDGRLGRRILETASAIFYKERTWPRLLRDLSAAGHIGDVEREALEDWLVEGRVNLKQIDALACLQTALSLGPASRVARPFPPATLFSAALAEQAALKTAVSRTSGAPR